MGEYEEFLASKFAAPPATGFDPGDGVVHPQAFDYQQDIVRWGLRRGRAAIFAGTGLGKTLMELAWSDHVANHTGGRVLVLAPLAVAQQTEREAATWGIGGVKYLREDDGEARIVVTNYELLDRFDVSVFVGVVLDESSILKHHTAKTRTALIDAFRETPYKLCGTATPAPNDHTELGNHAEFLGVCSRSEMLATYFCHDGGETQTWRLKGHAEQEFWRWVATWAVMLRSPEDLGYDGSRHVLPALHVHQHTVETDGSIAKAAGLLFASDVKTMAEQRAARKASAGDRVSVAASLVAAEPDEPWLIWCDLNMEADALESAIDGAVQVAGSDDPETKTARILGFSRCEPRVLVTKPSIAGFGVNWQHCARMIFVGVTHSWETYFQAVRRCWRFGQTREVHVYVITSDVEGGVVANLQRKERDADVMARGMVEAMAEVSRAAVHGSRRVTTEYNPTTALRVPAWLRSEVE